MKIVKVSLNDSYGYGKLYDFKAEDHLKVGDIVVCDTAKGLNVGTVKEITENADKAAKWVVDTVDMEKHKIRLAKEAELKKIKTKMDKRRKQLEEDTVYLQLAKFDDEMAKLVEEYNRLK